MMFKPPPNWHKMSILEQLALLGAYGYGKRLRMRIEVLKQSPTTNPYRRIVQRMTKLAEGMAILYVVGLTGIPLGACFENLPVILASGLLSMLSVIVLLILDAIDSRK